MEKFKKTIMNMKIYFTIFISYVTPFQFFMISFLFLKDLAEILSISKLIIVFIFILLLLFSFSFGWATVKMGMFSYEQDFNMSRNPKFMELLNDVKEIKKTLKEELIQN